MNSLSTSHQNSIRFGFRAGLALALATAGLLLGGCATYSPANNLELFARTAPLPTLVAPGTEMAAAEALAAKGDYDMALHGVGSSMEPVYVSGTAIVVHPCSFRSLRKGMAVVYVNRRGHYVAHMLVEDMPKGWFAIGLNNAEVDDDYVTANNLVGVIKEAYTANNATFREDIAARIALKNAVASSSARVTMN